MQLTFNDTLNRYEFRTRRDEKDANGRMGLALASSAAFKTTWQGREPIFITTDPCRALQLSAHASEELRAQIEAAVKVANARVPVMTFKNGVYIWQGPPQGNGIEYRATPKRAGFAFTYNAYAELPRSAGADIPNGEGVWWSEQTSKAIHCAEYADEAARLRIGEVTAKKHRALEASRAEDSDIEVIVPEGLTPYGFQRASLAYAIPRTRVLFGDEMGLGKTIQALLWLNWLANELNRSLRVLIVCPATLKRNWMKEMVGAPVLDKKGWLVRPTTVGIADSRYSTVVPNTDIVIINYEMMSQKIDTGKRKVDQKTGKVKKVYEYRLRESLKRQWDLMIIDEAHKLKGDPAHVIRSRMAYSVKADRVAMLTGTPMVNRPRELWFLLNYLAPKVFKNKAEFMERYCAGGSFMDEYAGAQNLPELQEKLRLFVMVRRLKRNVLKDLPPKMRQVIELPADSCGDLIKTERLAFEKKQDVLTNIRLRVELSKASENPEDYKNSVALLTQGIKVAFEELSLIRKETAVAKIPLVREHVTAILSEGHKVLLFCHHKEVAYALEKEFAGQTVVITGDTKLAARDKAVTDFQSNDKIRLFIGTIGAAGAGLTLTASSYVVFAELDWVPGSITQAEDRCILEGQLVQTKERGFLPIECVAVGDTVLTQHGRWKPVLKTHGRQIRDWESITEIDYERFDKPLRCTSDHMLLIKRGSARPGWIKAENVYPRDLLCFPRVALDTNAAAWYFDIGGRSLVPDADWLYFFGWYLAEGYASLGRGRFVSLSGHSDEIPILNRLASKVTRSLGLNSRTRDRRPKKNAAEVRICGNQFADWMAEQFGRTCKDKRIPHWLYGLLPEQTYSLLRGYWDGDGEEKEGRYQKWVTSASLLGTQIAQLAAAYGYSPGMHSEINEVGTEMWRGRCALGGRSRGGKDDKYIYYLVSSVKNSIAPQRAGGKRVRVHDLTVEQDHSFVVGMATVHNCHRIGQTDSVLIQHLVLEGSLDKRMADVLVEKQDIADRALDRESAEELLDEPITPDREKMATQGVSAKDVTKLAEKMGKEDIAAVHLGLRLLAGLHKDSKILAGQTFREVDAPLGKILAEAKSLSPKMAALGKTFLRRYSHTSLAIVPEIQTLFSKETK